MAHSSPRERGAGARYAEDLKCARDALAHVRELIWDRMAELEWLDELPGREQVGYLDLVEVRRRELRATLTLLRATLLPEAESCVAVLARLAACHGEAPSE